MRIPKRINTHVAQEAPSGGNSPPFHEAELRYIFRRGTYTLKSMDSDLMLCGGVYVILTMLALIETMTMSF